VQNCHRIDLGLTTLVSVIDCPLLQRRSVASEHALDLARPLHRESEIHTPIGMPWHQLPRLQGRARIQADHAHELPLVKGLVATPIETAIGESLAFEHGSFEMTMTLPWKEPALVTRDLREHLPQASAFGRHTKSTRPITALASLPLQR
jgi:hypothetical protein